MSNPIKQVLYPEAHLGRNPFPMDNRHIMSAKLGMKIPCYYRATVPKGVYDIDLAAVSRTSELQTANFSRISPNIDFYFVPYSMMFHRFNDVYNGRSDKQRREKLPFASNIPDVTTLPNFSLPALLNTLYYYWLITEDGDLIRPTSQAGRVPVRWRSIAVNLETRTFGDDGIKDISFGVNPGLTAQQNELIRDVFGNISIEDRLRLLDMLGYGNWLPVFKTFTSLWLRSVVSVLSSVSLDFDIRVYIDYVNNQTTIFGYDTDGHSISETFNVLPAWRNHSIAKPSTLMNIILNAHSAGDDLKTVVLDAQGEFSFDLYLVWVSLADRLKTIDYFTKSTGSVSSQYFLEEFGKRLSVFALAAYQKIWSDYSRNQFYDIETDYSQFFNYDWYDDSKSMEHELNADQIMCLLTTPRYAAWRKDIFTGSLPNAQFGDVAVAMLNGDSSVFGSNPDANGTDFLDGNFISQNTDGSVSGFSPDESKFLARTSSVGVSVASIRYANALQRYRETIMRAGNRTKDLWRAQFGVTSKFIDDNYSIYLGSFDGDYNINPVQATSNNDSTTLGQLGANGLAVIKGNKLQVNTSDFGLIIGVLTIVPRTEYDNFGISEHNLKLEQFDFWNSQFENLGLQAVLKHQFNVMSDLTGEEIEGQSDVVFGYSARYHEYKTEVDKVHGEFFGSNPLADCDTPIHDGAFSDFVTPRPVDDFRMPLLENIYINPHSCDSIFYKAADQFQASDHFKFAIGISETDVLPMSVTGLPHAK